MQSNLPLTQEKQAEQSPTPEQKNSKKFPVFWVVLLAIVLIAAGGLGFWAYTLNSNLTATQQQLATLQGEHDKLQADYAQLKSDNEKMTADFNQTTADLESTKKELATAQADLKKSRDQNKSLQSKIDVAIKKAEILYAVSTVKSAKDFLAVDTLIKATNDNQLLKEWDNFTSSPTTDGSVKFLLYLIGSVRDGLK
jgi:septal ring factor EnvC (AmiA/AmiB activator)